MTKKKPSPVPGAIAPGDSERAREMARRRWDKAREEKVKQSPEGQAQSTAAAILASHGYDWNDAPEPLRVWATESVKADNASTLKLFIDFLKGQAAEREQEAPDIVINMSDEAVERLARALEIASEPPAS